MRPEGFAHMLCGTRILGDRRTVDGMAFWRGAGERPFSDEDEAVVRVIHWETSPFFADLDVPLTPRARATLDHLLRGASDKEIAARLSISPHTVHQYVKSIYRAHGVHSRTELIARVRGRHPLQ